MNVALSYTHVYIPRISQESRIYIVATFVSGLSVALSRLLKALNFRVFRVIFARIWHLFIYLIAAFSFT